MAPIRKAAAIPLSNEEARAEYDRDEESDHENTDIEESDDEHVEESDDDSDDEDREVAGQSTHSKISKLSSRMGDFVVVSQVKPSHARSDSDSETDSESDSNLMDKNAKFSVAKAMEKVESVREKAVKHDPGGSEKSRSRKRVGTPQDTPRQPKKSRKEKVNGLSEFKDMKQQKPFQRVWSDTDEIALLRGMIAYASENGDDPSSHLGKFLDYIKNSLHFQVKKRQLDHKIRSLRKKFQEKAVKVKTGEKLRSPHDQEMFDLSSRIWSNHDSPLTPQIKGNQEKEKEKILGVDEVPQVVHAESPVEKETSGESLALYEMIKYYKYAGYDCCEEFLRCGMGNLDQTERLELDEAWKRINIMKSEVVLHMVKLVQRNIEAVLKATKK